MRSGKITVGFFIAKEEIIILIDIAALLCLLKLSDLFTDKLGGLAPG